MPPKITLPPSNLIKMHRVNVIDLLRLNQVDKNSIFRFKISGNQNFGIFNSYSHLLSYCPLELKKKLKIY